VTRRPIASLILLILLFTLCAAALEKDDLARLDPALRAGLLTSKGEITPEGVFYPLFDPDRFQITLSPLTGEAKIGVLVKLKRPIMGMT